jgi:hypothetical protein
LVDIWNIISDNYEFKENYLVLPTEIYEQINDFIATNNLDKKFTKKWYEYKNNFSMSRGPIDVNSYNLIVKRREIRANERKIKEEESKKQQDLNYQEDLQTLAALQEVHKDSWLNSDWIQSIIGTYDNPFAEYYWTLIGRKGYKVKDWKKNLLIREDIYNTIYNDNTFKTYSGKRFLANSFKNEKGFSTHIVGTFPYVTADESGYGIYGIYYLENDEVDPELIYVGMTQKGFQSRWEEHMRIFQGKEQKPSGMILYQQNLDPKKIAFSKLIDIKELKYEGLIGLSELKAMELGCITVLSPKYNIVGVSKPYIM